MAAQCLWEQHQQEQKECGMRGRCTYEHFAKVVHDNFQGLAITTKPRRFMCCAKCAYLISFANSGPAIRSLAANVRTPMRACGGNACAR